MFLLASSRPLLSVNAARVSDAFGHLAGNLVGLLLGSLEALLLAGEEGVDGSVELVAAVKEIELHHEEEADEVTAELADERAGSGSGSTCKIGSLANHSTTSARNPNFDLPVAMMSSTMITF